MLFRSPTPFKHSGDIRYSLKSYKLASAMSNKYYDELLSEAINDYNSLYSEEFGLWDKKVAEGQRLNRPDKPQAYMEFMIHLYISYVKNFRKLEDVYDQLTHPQKRMLFRAILDNTMMRLVEIRHLIVVLNTAPDAKAPKSNFVNFDELLFSLKITPEQLEIPIPRYLREDTPAMLERDHRVEDYLKMEDRHLPEEEEIAIRNPVEMEPGTEIWMILVNERGRQGIQRGVENREKMKMKKKNKNKEANEPNKEEQSMFILQKYIRAFIDREAVEKMRNEEMEFLGILPSKPKLDDLPFLKVDPKTDTKAFISSEVDRIKEKRRGKQREKKAELQATKDKIVSNIEEHETPDMKENLMYQMRNWITEYYERHEGKELPLKIDDFYTKNETAVPLTKEEADAKRKEMAEKEKAAKKAAEDLKKGKLTEAQKFMKEREAMGPENSLPFKLLNQDMQKYVETWMSTDDSDIFEQRPDKELIVKEVMPQIEEKVKFSYIDQN